MKSIIVPQHLTKRFGSFDAVEDVSLWVEQGEIYGFLGLNGAGKTTTIRMLSGLIAATGGTGFLLTVLWWKYADQTK